MLQWNQKLNAQGGGQEIIDNYKKIQSFDDTIRPKISLLIWLLQNMIESIHDFPTKMQLK